MSVVLNAGEAFVGVFFEQGFQHGAGLLAVLSDIVSLLNVVSSLAAS